MKPGINYVYMSAVPKDQKLDRDDIENMARGKPPSESKNTEGETFVTPKQQRLASRIEKTIQDMLRELGRINPKNESDRVQIDQLMRYIRTLLDTPKPLDVILKILNQQEQLIRRLQSNQSVPPPVVDPSTAADDTKADAAINQANEAVKLAQQQAKNPAKAEEGFNKAKQAVARAMDLAANNPEAKAKLKGAQKNWAEALAAVRGQVKLKVDEVEQYKGQGLAKTTTKKGKASKFFDALEAEEDQAEQSKLNVRKRQREFRNMVAQLEEELETTKQALAEALKAEQARREAVNAGIKAETEARYKMYSSGFMALWWYMQKYLFGVKRDADGNKVSGEPRLTATWSGYPGRFFNVNRKQMLTNSGGMRWIGDTKTADGKSWTLDPNKRRTIWPNRKKQQKEGMKVYLFQRTWDDFKKMRVQEAKEAKEARKKYLDGTK